MIIFFRQKTGYAVLRSLVGSGMCIGDRRCPDLGGGMSEAELDGAPQPEALWLVPLHRQDPEGSSPPGCRLYTTEAADE